MADPLAMGRRAALFEPVKAIAVTLPIDQIQFAIVVYIEAENWKAGITEVPVSVPHPLVIIRVDLLEPSMSRQHVSFSITIDIGNPNPVAVLLAAAQMMHPR